MYELSPTPKQAHLIALEGIDLSGRTTQVQLLRDWLLAQGYGVTTTAWRTSPLISDIIERTRTRSPLHPLTYSMLYCADHLDRTERIIKPALKRGDIVLADRYIYTAFARDEANGLDVAWVRNLYRFSVPPDAVFYLHISPDESVKRRMALRELSRSSKSKKSGKQRKWEAMQTVSTVTEVNAINAAKIPSFTPETLESFRSFEKKMYSQYQSMQQEFGFSVIEGSQSIELVQAMLRRAVMRLLWEE